MSEYELVREDNISRNEAFLESLGLNDLKPKSRLRRKREDMNEETETKSIKTKKKQDVKKSAVEPTR